MSANVNPSTGIAYGVTSGHSAPHLMDEIMNNGRNLTWEVFKEETIKAIQDTLENAGASRHGLKDVAESAFDACNWDHYEADEEEYDYEDADGNQFRLGWLGGAPLIWCIRTNKIVSVRSACSPCVPNAGDLDSGERENGYECYGVPDDYLGDE